MGTERAPGAGTAGFRQDPGGSAVVVLYAALLVAASLALQANIGFQFSDEGFLWYGAVQTLDGEVPLRDFQSYDPGRYYWSAFWMLLLGKSVLALRVALAIFQFIGLALGLLFLREATRSLGIVALAGLILVIWMSPRYHRLFETSVSLATVFFALWLIRRPSLGRHLTAGVVTGLAAFIGRNLGAYAVLSFIFVILMVWLRLDRAFLGRKLTFWGIGVVLGYLPMITMIVFVPGVLEGFLSGLETLARTGSTNLPKPVPWPWLFDYGLLSVQAAAHAFSLGAFFLLLPVFHVVAVASVLFTRRGLPPRSAPLLASTAVGVPYIHYAYSRPDLEHLLVAVPTLLLTSLCLCSSRNRAFQRLTRAVLLFGFAALTVASAGVESPAYWKWSKTEGSLTKYDLGGQGIWIDRRMAELIEAVRTIDRIKVPRDEGFLIAPYCPAFYVVLERVSPLKDIYFLHLQTRERQEQMIAELKRKRVNWVLLGNVGLHDTATPAFRGSYERLWRHLREDFVPVRAGLLPRGFQLLRRADPVPRMGAAPEDGERVS